MRGSLSRDELLEVLDELSERLERKKVRASIYIVGGAAMALAFDRTRTTHDIDGRIDEGPRRTRRSSARDRTPQRVAGELAERPGHTEDADGTGQESSHRVRIGVPHRHRGIGRAHSGNEAGIRKGLRPARCRHAGEALEYSNRGRGHGNPRTTVSVLSQGEESARDDGNRVAGDWPSPRSWSVTLRPRRRRECAGSRRAGMRQRSRASTAVHGVHVLSPHGVPEISRRTRNPRCC